MKYNAPDYDPKLSPERNAEIAEWAKKNYETMQRGRFDSDEEKTDTDIYHEMIENDFDEDAVTDE